MFLIYRKAIGHQHQANAGRLRRLTQLNRRSLPALAKFL